MKEFTRKLNPPHEPALRQRVSYVGPGSESRPESDSTAVVYGRWRDRIYLCWRGYRFAMNESEFRKKFMGRFLDGCGGDPSLVDSGDLRIALARACQTVIPLIIDRNPFE